MLCVERQLPNFPCESWSFPLTSPANEIFLTPHSLSHTIQSTIVALLVFSRTFRTADSPASLSSVDPANIMAPVYVVTGASRGIGYELVRQLVKRGDIVVGAARNPETASNLKELESSASGRLHLVKLDVEKPETIQSAAASLEKEFPQGIDVLINNAGVSGPFLQGSQE